MDGDKQNPEHQPASDEAEGPLAAQPSSTEQLQVQEFETVNEGLLMLGALASELRRLEAQRLATVRDLRRAGATWDQIATALGENTRTVYQRWAHRI